LIVSLRIEQGATDLRQVSAKLTKHLNGGSRRDDGAVLEVFSKGSGDREATLVDRLVPVKEGVILLLRSIFEDGGLKPETTIAALRAASDPLLANQCSLQDSLTAHTEVLFEFAEDLSIES
jgi:hypothetical protein